MPELLLADGRRVPYAIRVSRRASRVRLTLNARDGMVLVTPPGMEGDWLTELVESWRGWVARQIDRLGMMEADPAAALLPERVVLHAAGEDWSLLYRYNASSSPRVRQNGEFSLLLSGNCADVPACQAALRRWLARRGRELLPGMLEQIAQQTGLSYRSVAIRGQRSRWGSCSAQGDITLNHQLLLLPAELARHVLIHELCHTRELNHSPRFWNTVRQFEPDLDARRVEMRRSWSLLPGWAIREG